MTLEINSLPLLKNALEKLNEGFDQLPPMEHDLDIKRMEEVLNVVSIMMRDNYPYHHPYYLGQMLKPPHPIARLAYALSLWINPNNHALDGGRASSAMEKESVASIASMFGWDKHLGHLCSGGTMANLEGLWVSSQMKPGKKILASQQAHYTHSRISAVLGIPFESVACDNRARMDINDLRTRLECGDVGTVVVTVGSTATGSVDPLMDILSLEEEYGFRIHADAAYGGYFILTNNLRAETRAVYDHLSEVDSIVIDPHKHGLQPYGCGCVLFKDPSVGKLYKHDSPYTYFTSGDLHLGEISLECSRPGASAVALWATMKMFPLNRGGEFAQSLAAGREACLDLFNRIDKDPRFQTAFAPELDILIFAPKVSKVSTASRIATDIFDKGAKRNLHMALAKFPKDLFGSVWSHMEWDQDTITCVRMCLMKPQHKQWINEIWKEFDIAASEAFQAT